VEPLSGVFALLAVVWNRFFSLFGVVNGLWQDERWEWDFEPGRGFIDVDTE